ncbi:MAG: aromatic acid exporter family protein [Oxalobacter sp.]
MYEFFNIGTGIPFYAGIATVICLQSEIKSTVRVGLNRTVGTLLGGFTGMGILYLTHNYYILGRPILRYGLITLCIIPLMYIANIIRKVRIPIGWDETSLFPGTKVFIDFLKKSTLTNITCIAFLSVTITHGGDVSITEFATNRIIDTLIGVAVSFFINLIPSVFLQKPAIAGKPEPQDTQPE